MPAPSSRRPVSRAQRPLVRALGALLALVALIGGLACTSPGSASTTSTATVQPPPVDAAAAQALAQLTTLAVKGRAPMTGYSRDAFGPAWKDVDHNGCDTRNDILQRDLTAIVFQAGSTCVVASGSLADPYTGKNIAFLRGEGTSTAVQIDHVVALGDAWQTGAFQWTDEKRLELANDPQELLAVNGPTNEAKGDGDAATWLPPNKSFRCSYIEIQVSVKAKYGLWVTPAEHDAMSRILKGCSGAN